MNMFNIYDYMNLTALGYRLRGLPTNVGHLRGFWKPCLASWSGPTSSVAWCVSKDWPKFLHIMSFS